MFVFFLTASVIVPGKLMSQDKTTEDQTKELKILKEIEQQKRELADQKKAAVVSDSVLNEQEEENDDSLRIVVDDAAIAAKAGAEAQAHFNEAMRNFKGKNFHFRMDQPFMAMPGMDNFDVVMDGHDGEGTNWQYSRSVKQTSFSRDYIFDVEKTAHTVIMSINGDCKNGEIRVRITMPNGKSFSDVVMDESGDLNWRKSLNITDNENQDKTGEWKFQITSSKATGYFKISFQTN
jgi:hypothetical protein